MTTGSSPMRENNSVLWTIFLILAIIALILFIL